MADGNFDTWLAEKLNSLSLDEDVYSDYLKSVLDEGETEEDLRESLCDILSGVLVSEHLFILSQSHHIWYYYSNDNFL